MNYQYCDRESAYISGLDDARNGCPKDNFYYVAWPTATELALWEAYEEGYEEEDLSGFAYQGFGPVCLAIGCKHWGGDSLCDLAIEWMVAEDCGREGPDEACPLS